MTQHILGTLLSLVLCLGSAAAVPDTDEPYKGILDMADRRTTFAVAADGAVYSASWGDFGPSLARDPADADREDLVPAMELRDPRKLCVKSWCGSAFAIDQSGALWGWGSSISGSLGNGMTEGGPDAPVRILDAVSDVRYSAELSLALKTDGSLWVWGGMWSSRPVWVMDGVGAISDGGLVLTRSGEVWSCRVTGTLPEGAVSPDIFEPYVPAAADGRVILSDGGRYSLEASPWRAEPLCAYLVLERELSGCVKVEDRFAFDAFGGAWMIDPYGASDAVWLCGDAVHACVQTVGPERCAVVLGRDGVLRRFAADGTGGQAVADSVKQVVRGTRAVTYIDQNGQLWRAGGSGASLIAGSVLFAVGCGDDFVAYIRSDGTLWLDRNDGAPQKVLENMKLPA